MCVAFSAQNWQRRGGRMKRRRPPASPPPAPGPVSAPLPSPSSPPFAPLPSPHPPPPAPAPGRPILDLCPRLQGKLFFFPRGGLELRPHTLAAIAEYDHFLGHQLGGEGVLAPPMVPPSRLP